MATCGFVVMQFESKINVFSHDIYIVYGNIQRLLSTADMLMGRKPTTHRVGYLEKIAEGLVLGF